MKKIKVGVTGQAGFIGTHLARTVEQASDLELIPFDRCFFQDDKALREFTEKCDVIVHLAGLSRHADGEYLYRTNTDLTERLCRCTDRGTIFLGSTTHEAKDSPYHASKRESRARIEQWAATGENRTCRTLLMANTFGPSSRPFYNSVVSTFCVLALRGETPERIDNVPLQLIYVDDLCRAICDEIQIQDKSRTVATIPHNWEISLPDLWQKLVAWSKLPGNALPDFPDRNEKNLFLTLQSYR